MPFLWLAPEGIPSKNYHFFNILCVFRFYTFIYVMKPASAQRSKSPIL